MTDKLKAPQMTEKVFLYLTGLTRELRKALQTKFEHEYKGILLNTVEPAMRREVETWINQRDKNTKLTHTRTVTGKGGEVTLDYSGQTKDADFRLTVNATFTLAQSQDKTITYLKNLNVTAEKRDIIIK